MKKGKKWHPPRKTKRSTKEKSALADGPDAWRTKRQAVIRNLLSGEPTHQAPLEPRQDIAAERRHVAADGDAAACTPSYAALDSAAAPPWAFVASIWHRGGIIKLTELPFNRAGTLLRSRGPPWFRAPVVAVATFPPLVPVFASFLPNGRFYWETRRERLFSLHRNKRVRGSFGCRRLPVLECANESRSLLQRRAFNSSLPPVSQFGRQDASVFAAHSDSR